MSRVRNVVASRRRRNKILARASGFYGSRGTLIRTARDTVHRADAYSFAHRRLWIIRINAACRENGLSYSKFINGLSKLEIAIDRKILAELAVNDPGAFTAIAEKASAAL